MATATKNPQRKLTTLELSAPARARLGRLKKKHRYSHRTSVEMGIGLLETKLESEGRGL